MRTISPLVRRALVAGPLASVLFAGGVTATTSPPTTEPPTSEPSPAPSDEFCVAAWEIRDAAETIDALAEDDDADPDAVHEAYDQLATATADATAAAPPELADGLTLLAGQAGLALAVVEANQFDLAAAEADPRWQALGEFEQRSDLPAVQADVVTYVDTNCAALLHAAICDAASDFETASDAFGAAIADEELTREQLQQAFTDYFAELDRLIEAGPAEVVDGLAQWRPIIDDYQEVFEANDWNVVDALFDPALVEISERIAGVEASPVSVEALASCDEASDTTDEAGETTIG